MTNKKDFVLNLWSWILTDFSLLVIITSILHVNAFLQKDAFSLRRASVSWSKNWTVTSLLSLFRMVYCRWSVSYNFWEKMLVKHTNIRKGVLNWSEFNSLFMVYHRNLLWSITFPHTVNPVRNGRTESLKC